LRRLIGVEVRRLASRPLSRGLLVAAAVVALGAAIVVAVLSHPATQAAVERSELEYERTVEQCIRSGFRPPFALYPKDARAEFCEEAVPKADFTFQLTLLDDVLEGVDVPGTSFPLTMAAGVLGASFLGAEFTRRTMTVTLTWIPDRVRVIVSKVVSAGVAVFVMALVLQLFVGLVLAAAAGLRGTTGGMSAEVIADTFGAGARVAAVASLAAMAGASLAVIAGSTAGALGIGLLYALVETLIKGLEDVAWLRWLLGENAVVFVVGGGERGAALGRSVLDSTVILVVSTAALFGAAVALFSRRDLA